MENLDPQEWSAEDIAFWMKEMDEWRASGENNVFEFPGMIRALGFGGIKKSEANALFQMWTKKYS